jgi:hypothetical protein
VIEVDLETVVVAHVLAEAFDDVVVDLLDGATALADQMVMVAVPGVLPEEPATADIDLPDQAIVMQPLEVAIDGGHVDQRVAGGNLGVDRLGREVLGAALDDLEHQ